MNRQTLLTLEEQMRTTKTYYLKYESHNKSTAVYFLSLLSAGHLSVNESSLMKEEEEEEEEEEEHFVYFLLLFVLNIIHVFIVVMLTEPLPVNML